MFGLKRKKQHAGTFGLIGQSIAFDELKASAGTTAWGRQAPIAAATESPHGVIMVDTAQGQDLQNVVGPEPQSELDRRLGYNLNHLPEGLVIKRVYSRQGPNGETGNKWRVNYENGGTEYYAPTLEGALERFFDLHPVHGRRFLDNINRDQEVSER